MADSYGSVSLQESQSNRLAQDYAPADNHSFLALERKIIVFQELYNPEWQDAAGNEGQSRRPFIRDLRPPDRLTAKIKNVSILETLRPEVIKSLFPSGLSGNLNALQDRLWGKVHRTFLNIKSELNSRLVFGIGCVPMILIGLALGIFMKGGHLLSAFGASCIPAAMLIVCIMTCKNLITNQSSHTDIVGVWLMWSGLGLLLLITLMLYRKLLRH